MAPTRRLVPLEHGLRRAPSGGKERQRHASRSPCPRFQARRQLPEQHEPVGLPVARSSAATWHHSDADVCWSPHANSRPRGTSNASTRSATPDSAQHLDGLRSGPLAGEASVQQEADRIFLELDANLGSLCCDNEVKPGSVVPDAILVSNPAAKTALEEMRLLDAEWRRQQKAIEHDRDERAKMLEDSCGWLRQENARLAARKASEQKQRACEEARLLKLEEQRWAAQQKEYEIARVEEKRRRVAQERRKLEQEMEQYAAETWKSQAQQLADKRRELEGRRLRMEQRLKYNSGGPCCSEDEERWGSLQEESRFLKEEALRLKLRKERVGENLDKQRAVVENDVMGAWLAHTGWRESSGNECGRRSQVRRELGDLEAKRDGALRKLQELRLRESRCVVGGGGCCCPPDIGTGDPCVSDVVAKEHECCYPTFCPADSSDAARARLAPNSDEDRVAEQLRKEVEKVSAKQRQIEDGLWLEEHRHKEEECRLYDRLGDTREHSPERLESQHELLHEDYRHHREEQRLQHQLDDARASCIEEMRHLQGHFAATKIQSMYRKWSVQRKAAHCHDAGGSRFRLFGDLPNSVTISPSGAGARPRPPAVHSQPLNLCDLRHWLAKQQYDRDEEEAASWMRAGDKPCRGGVRAAEERMDVRRRYPQLQNQAGYADGDMHDGSRSCQPHNRIECLRRCMASLPSHDHGLVSESGGGPRSSPRWARQPTLAHGEVTAAAAQAHTYSACGVEALPAAVAARGSPWRRNPRTGGTGSDIRSGSPLAAAIHLSPFRCAPAARLDHDGAQQQAPIESAHAQLLQDMVELDDLVARIS